jgi:hypothetical protein
MGIFDKLFNKKLTKEIKSNDTFTSNTSESNFDKLVEKARNSGETVDLEILYKSFLKLEQWVFIVSKNCEVENARPFIGELENQPWLYVFTESLKADSYAKLFPNFLTEGDNTLVLKMSRTNSLNMIQELNNRGVFGLRINEGENGWFCSIQELFEIINHYKIDIN